MKLRDRSQDQEKRAAKRYGGRTTPASGARSVKGDVRSKGVFRQECKFTLARQYSLKLADLQKIKQEAIGDEIPFLEIEFQGVTPHERYVVLRECDLRGLLKTQELYRVLRTEENWRDKAPKDD
jgi:hypothetical protein